MSGRPVSVAVVDTTVRPVLLLSSLALVSLLLLLLLSSVFVDETVLESLDDVLLEASLLPDLEVTTLVANPDPC